MLRFVERKHAYGMFGRIPFLAKKIPYKNLKIMVDSEPTMRRPYIVMEANPERFPTANGKGAHAPHLPTDQRAKLQARHAARYAKEGDEAPVCTSCHGAHGILSPRDPRSTVHPTRVTDRCARCHARPEKPGAVERFAGSVHQAALARGDAGSAACPACHGSHSAYTPGPQSVANVCGRCHPRNAELLRASAHRAPLEAKPPGGCGACHDSQGSE